MVCDADDLGVSQRSFAAGVDIIDFDLREASDDVVLWILTLALHGLEDVVLQLDVLFCCPQLVFLPSNVAAHAAKPFREDATPTPSLLVCFVTVVTGDTPLTFVA